MGPRSLLHWGLEVSVLSIPKHRRHADRVLGPKPSAGAEGTAVTGHLPPLAGSTASSQSPGRRPAGGTAKGPRPARVSRDGRGGEAVWQRTLTHTRSQQFTQVHKRMGRGESGAGRELAGRISSAAWRVPPEGALSVPGTRKHTQRAPARSLRTPSSPGLCLSSISTERAPHSPRSPLPTRHPGPPPQPCASWHPLPSSGVDPGALRPSSSHIESMQAETCRLQMEVQHLTPTVTPRALDGRV